MYAGILYVHIYILTLILESIAWNIRNALMRKCNKSHNIAVFTDTQTLRSNILLCCLYGIYLSLSHKQNYFFLQLNVNCYILTQCTLYEN